MILGLIVLFLIASIAYFHAQQGLLSAVLSAVLAVLAAVMAISYHEPLGAMLYPMVGEYALAVALVALFAGIYIVLRILFDMMVPGNVNVPNGLNKGAGLALGVIVGIFATGVLVVAAQAMPVGPSVLGYSRYKVTFNRSAVVPRTGSGSQAADAFVNVELTENQFQPENRSRLLIPVDDIVLGMTNYLSKGGSLAGSQTLEQVHPNYPDELFGTRLGIQPGAKRTAINASGMEEATVQEVYLTKALPAQIDAELRLVRQNPVTQPLAAPSGQVFAIVRMGFGDSAAEMGGPVHISPAGVRLVAPLAGEWTSYYPIGTMEGADRLFANRVDDPLFIRSGAGADFVFLVDEAALLQNPGAEQQVINNGVFVEAKRLARVDLSGQPVATSDAKPLTAGASQGVIRKEAVLNPPEPRTPTGGAPRGGAPAGGRPTGAPAQ